MAVVGASPAGVATAAKQEHPFGSISDLKVGAWFEPDRTRRHSMSARTSKDVTKVRPAALRLMSNSTPKGRCDHGRILVILEGMRDP
jgi:hypothetical protein